jgi:hypothetical protein
LPEEIDKAKGHRNRNTRLGLKETETLRQQEISDSSELWRHLARAIICQVKGAKTGDGFDSNFVPKTLMKM